jgi:hypothetical protein
MCAELPFTHQSHVDIIVHVNSPGMPFCLFTNSREQFFSAGGSDQPYSMFVAYFLEPYYLAPVLCSEGETMVTRHVSKLNSTPELWHARLGHLHYDLLQRLPSMQSVKGIWFPDKQKTLPLCKSCVLAKSHRAPIPKNRHEKAAVVLQIVHMDIAIVKHESRDGEQVALVIVDECSSFVSGTPMHTKDESLQWFKQYHQRAITRTGKPLVAIQCDRDSTFHHFKPFAEYCALHGIQWRQTQAHTPHQNGVAERMNRTLFEMTRALLYHARLPPRFWADAFRCAVHIRNRCPSRVLYGGAKCPTPYEKWFGQAPDVSYFRVFGCIAFYNVRKEDRDDRKLSPCAVECRHIGYDEEAQGYLLWCPVTQKLIRSRDVIFDETCFPGEHPSPYEGLQRPISYETPVVWPTTRPPLTNDKPQIVQTPTRRIVPLGDDLFEGSDALTPTGSKRGWSSLPKRTPKRSRNSRNCVDNICEVTFHAAFLTDPVVSLLSGGNSDLDNPPCVPLSEPKTYKQALTSPDKEKWLEAMQKEYSSLIKNKVFELVPRPNDRAIVTCKWAFKVKRKVDGSIERYKARLCARGFTQVLGIDYEETFAPVVKFCTVRCFLTIAFQRKLQVYHLDIETAFLNATLEEEIYMEQPPGFTQQGGYVCLLKKCLYGLKQSGRMWHQEFKRTLLEYGFIQAKSDECLFTASVDMFLCLYVDDILIALENDAKLKIFLDHLLKKYVVKNNGLLNWYLGIEILTEPCESVLSQRVYVEKLLDRFKMSDSKPAKTPMDANDTRSSDASKEIKMNELLPPTEPYRELIGCLMYSMVATRPDIAYAVGYLSRQVSNPTGRHWTQAKRVLRYLKHTKDLGLRVTRCNPEDFKLCAYVDADWGRDPTTGKSTTGCVLYLGNVPILWTSRLQRCVALSSTESEYVALSECVKDVLWVSRLLVDFGIPCIKVPIYEDNAGCIKLAKNPVFHKRTKHINIRYHFVRDQVADGTVELVWLPTADMVADALTKPLSQFDFDRKRRRLMNCH